MLTFGLPSLVSILVTFAVLRWLARRLLQGPLKTGVDGKPLSQTGKLTIFGIGFLRLHSRGDTARMAGVGGRDLREDFDDSARHCVVCREIAAGSPQILRSTRPPDRSGGLGCDQSHSKRRINPRVAAGRHPLYVRKPAARYRRPSSIQGWRSVIKRRLSRRLIPRYRPTPSSNRAAFTLVVSSPQHRKPQELYDRA